MTLFFNVSSISYLGYAAIFSFMALGFLFLRGSGQRAEGPGYWALGYLANALGFVLWSLVLPIPDLVNYGLGELLHFCSFFLLIVGAYRFVGYGFRWWNLWVAIGLIAVWLFGLWQIQMQVYLAAVILKAVRSFMFLLGGLLLLNSGDGRAKGQAKGRGRMLAGISLLAWSVWVIVYAFIRIDALKDLLFGIMVGLQVLASFGMIIMLVEKRESAGGN